MAITSRGRAAGAKCVRGVAALVHGIALTLGYIVVIVLVYGVLEQGCLWIDAAQRHSNVRELARFADEPELGADEQRAGDFDGDGVPDELRTEYHNAEPLFTQRTSGMVYLDSGETGKPIFSHKIGAPILSGGWVDDHDGDGLADILLRDREGWVIFGLDGGEQ